MEVLQDASLRVLPVGPAEVKRMLTELRGLPLLQGGRGRPPADLDAVAEAITSIGQAATSLGGALSALEVNPLWVSGDSGPKPSMCSSSPSRTAHQQRSQPNKRHLRRSVGLAVGAGVVWPQRLFIRAEGTFDERLRFGAPALIHVEQREIR